MKTFGLCWHSRDRGIRIRVIWGKKIMEYSLDEITAEWDLVSDSSEGKRALDRSCAVL